MPGKRSVYLALALAAMLLIGHAITPSLYRMVVLNPALKEAIKRSDLDRVVTLIGQGADVNLSAPEASLAECPLALAALKGNSEVTRRLLGVGANVDQRSTTGATPLMLAAPGESQSFVMWLPVDHAGVARALLDAGADVNARDERQETALMYAAAHGAAHYEGSDRSRIYRDPEMTKILLAAGASPNLLDVNGESALSKAEQSGERKVANTLRAIGAKGLREELVGVPQAELFYAVRTQDLEAVKRLIRSGARVAVQDKEGMTPLMYAATQFDGILIRCLLKHSPDVKAALEMRDHQSRTVLYCAQAWDYSFRLLLQAGANPNGTGPNGESYFRFTNKSQHQLLLNAGATPPSK
jgi:ankyrin repeat protein